jgi:hypothetical protein
MTFDERIEAVAKKGFTEGQGLSGGSGHGARDYEDDSVRTMAS